jgi:sec-independent protein translocase protein TatB
MNILGVGPSELLFIFLIALIVLGPKDIVKASRTMGRWLRTIVKSDTWRIIRETSRELRNIPTKMMRESGLDDISKSIPTEAEIKNALGYDDLQKDVNLISSDLSSLKTDPGKSTTTSTIIKNQQSAQKSASTQEPPSSDWTTPRPKIIKPEPEILTPEQSELISPPAPSEITTEISQTEDLSK